jgi:hypothetical protein
MRGIPLLVAIAAALLLAGPGQASPVPVPPNTIVSAPNWGTGSEWHYSDGYAIKVKSVSPKQTVFERLDASGQWFSRQGFLRKDETSGTATRSSIYRTIPESAGVALSAARPLTFQREYMSNGKLMVHASSWTVEGRETITVPAGTFDCWLIVWRTRSLRSDWTGFERWWYSPQAQSYVRMEFKYGPAPESSRVLMRYHLAPAAGIATADVKGSAASTAQAASPLPQRLATAEPQAQGVDISPATSPAAGHTAHGSALGTAAAVRTIPQQAQQDATSAPDSDASVPLTAGPVTDTSRAMPADSTAKSRKKLLQADLENPDSWHAQVGSSQSEASIRAGLHRILQQHAQTRGLPSGILVHNLTGRGTFFRAWIGSYDQANGAERMCRSLKPLNCMPFKGATIEAKAMRVSRR